MTDSPSPIAGGLSILVLLLGWMHPVRSETAGGELVWPDDPRMTLFTASGAGPGPISWPVPLRDLCPQEGEAAGPVPPGSGSFDCEDRTPNPLRPAVSLGSFTHRPLAGRPAPFETFEPGRGSVRYDPELARAWAGLPAILELEAAHAFSPETYAFFRIGVRRDLAAWAEDRYALNTPASVAEIDLNEPSLGYLSYAGDWLEIVIGRFPVHWGPSREFGLAVSSSVRYHNAVQGAIKTRRARYRFLVSSLNPWLEGTPLDSVSGTGFPRGSEEWRQRNYPALPGSENAHKRVYDARIKTLLAHRVEMSAGPFAFGITESQVIGGKVPDLRDANPFAVFHNDFHAGYGNNSFSLDMLVRLPAGFSLGTELHLDDLEWAPTEGEGATPSLLGYLAGLRHAFRARGWAVVHSLHAIRTDPFLYGALQPLNTFSSRLVLTSNRQEPGDPVFVDKYVVDQPIGYLRGGDAFDFWYRAAADRSGYLRLAAEAGWLARGESGWEAPFEGYYDSHGPSPSGITERELRVSLRAAWRLARGLELGAGAGWSTLWNAGHAEGRRRSSPALSARIGWTP